MPPSEAFLKRLREKATISEPTKKPEKPQERPQWPQAAEERPEDALALEERIDTFIDALTPQERTTWENLEEIFPGEILDVRLAPKEQP